MACERKQRLQQKRQASIRCAASVTNRSTVGRRGRFRPAAAEEVDSEPCDLDLTDISFGGDAIGRVDGQVLFVPYGLPGERVRARVERRKRDYASASIVEVLSPSPDRVTPPCAVFGECGGCQWQHARYAAQLDMKRRVVAEQLRRIGGIADADDLVRPCIGMIEPWQYRNHIRFSLGKKYGDVGYTYRESHRLLRVDFCHIAHPVVNEVLEKIQRKCAGLRAHQITVRYGSNTGDLLVSPALPMVPEVESGQLVLSEEILSRRFQISGSAFFQVNTRREHREVPDLIRAPWIADRSGSFSMADLLALLVLDRLEAQPEDVVLDAYCGVGSFSALIAPRVGRVVGIEESPAAVRDAARNTEDLENTQFMAGKVEDVVGSLVGTRVDAVVLDPARVGCAPQVIGALLDLRPRRIVYVSCDPATLARDLRLLSDGGYDVQTVEPIDMFPQTYHIETVTTMCWGKG
ncbi:MAG: rumA [Chloroflexi bacterium]|nr:rumA [Chloroflexota bacterium]